MKTALRWLLLPLFGVACSNALATLSLSGNVTVEPDPRGLLRGQTATIVFTIANTGDEPFDEAVTGTTYFDWGPTSTIFPAGTAATPPCTFTLVDFSPPPGQPPLVGLTLFFRPVPLLPGETRQCVMEIAVSTEAAGPFTQSFGFNGSRGGRVAFFEQSVHFGLGQVNAVPAQSQLFSLVLVLAVLVIAYRHEPSRSFLRRRRSVL